ncbi:unnamed protein product [Cuscuta epithymum]|uniref:RanBP2-type domain-containing protein n=1 Tax=Cuscuta epithymum TaxID=186058 RepID=A0AAV0G5N0_9ASTE|nr:unnamed protein product [Cuscuta epithymum]CAH9143042.1 unnamed protein product [Cuscuta epithymum]
MNASSKFLTLLSTTNSPITLFYRPCCFLHRRSLTFARCLSTPPRRLTGNSSALLSSPRTPLTTFRRPFQSEALPVSSTHSSFSSTTHPWQEWCNLINAISADVKVEEHGVSPEDDGFVAYEQLPYDFLQAASACLAFARQRPNLLGSLSKRDIEVVVTNGTPFLFRTALETARRMRAFLGIDGNHALDRGDVHTIDIMKYIISYASNPAGSPGCNTVYSRELLETSIRNLLHQLVEVGWGPPASVLPPPGVHQFSGRAGETAWPAGKNIVMKRGDWICPKCKFMNFARNIKCLECEELRPRRQLTGGEWECPKCDFFNYGRNMVCLRCNSKRPAEASVNSDTRSLGDAYNKTETDEMFSENEPKAQIRFSKINDTAADEEDFPEKKLVVSTTRKTPLERMLPNSPYKGNSDRPREQVLNNGFTEDENKEKAAKPESWFTKMEKLHNEFPEIMQKKDYSSLTSRMNKREINKDFVPFVPFPPGFFATKETQSPDDKLDKDTGGTEKDTASNSKQNLRNSGWTGKSLEGSGVEEAEDPLDMSEEAKTKRWFKRVSQIKDISELSEIPDEDFPTIMPMRKGVNRFVVSKRKTPMERRLTSSTQYRMNHPVVSSNDEPTRTENDDNNNEIK